MEIQPNREQWPSPEQPEEEIEAEQATQGPPTAEPETPTEFPGGLDRESFFDAQPVEYT